MHIASSPDEAENIRRRLSAIEKEDEFDLVIHGTLEHVSIPLERAEIPLLKVFRSKQSKKATHIMKKRSIHYGKSMVRSSTTGSAR